MKLADIIKKNDDYNFVQEVPENFHCPRLPSGVFPVDFCTAGGLPIGSTSCIYGPPGGAKTTLALKYIKAAQEFCWRCCKYEWECECSEGPLKKAVIFVSIEGQFDFEWAEKMGVDTEQLIVSEPIMGEKAVDVIYDTLQAEEVGMVVLDSIGRLIPEAEIVDPAAKLQVGSKAKLVTRMINKVKTVLMQKRKEGQNCLFLGINQVRANLSGGPYGPPETVPGGFSSFHDWTLTIRQSQLKSPEIDKDTELPIIGRFKSSLVSPNGKRKLFILAGTAEYYIQLKPGLYPVGTILDQKTVLKYAENLDLIDKNKWSMVFEDEQFGTRKDMLARWDTDEQYYLSLKRKIIEQYAEAERNS